MQIKSNVKTFEVIWPDNKKTIYSFHVGNIDTLKSFVDLGENFMDRIKKIEEKSEIPEIFKLEQDVYSVLVGEKAWKEACKKTNSDVFALLRIVNGIGELLAAALDEAMKDAKSLTR